MSEEFVVVLTTLPLDIDADAFATTLVEEGLAACVHIHAQMTSVYRWQGAVHNDAERQLTLKTTRSQVAALSARLRELHPYDVPEFVVLPIIDGHSDYLAWIASNVNTGHRRDTEETGHRRDTEETQQRAAGDGDARNGGEQRKGS